MRFPRGSRQSVVRVPAGVRRGRDRSIHSRPRVDPADSDAPPATTDEPVDRVRRHVLADGAVATRRGADEGLDRGDAAPREDEALDEIHFARGGGHGGDEAAFAVVGAGLTFLSAPPAAAQFGPGPGGRAPFSPQPPGKNEAGRFDYYAMVMSWSPSYCAGLQRGGYDPQCHARDGKRLLRISAAPVGVGARRSEA